MGRKIKDWSGYQYGDITVLKPTENRDRKKGVIWECRCRCGNLTYVSARNIKRNSISKCEECKLSYAKQGPIRLLYANYWRHALTRNIEFTITFNEFMELISQKCHYCNSKPRSFYKKGVAHKYGIWYNGVDRVDSTEGYKSGNCVTCCKFCNLAKRDFPLDEFLDWLNHVRNYT